MRLLLRFVAAFVAALSVSIAPVAAAPKASGTPQLGTFRSEGVNQFASAQPTATGRQLVELEVFDGKIYAGYGDYAANTGPITISSHVPGSPGFSAEGVSETEAVYNYREIGGQLFSPAIDPRGSADYAANGPWLDRSGPGAFHVFDMVEFGGAMIMVGSQGDDAVAWRSTDAGLSWSESIRVAPQSDGTFSRFYFAGVLGSSLYVQASDWGSAHPTSLVTTDGTTWSFGPSLLSGDEFGWRPVTVGGKLVFQAYGHGYSGAVKTFDGVTVKTIAHGYDVTASGSTLYILDGAGTVLRSNDLQSVVPVGTAPAGARSLVVSQERLFVGTDRSELWSAPLPASSVPTTTTQKAQRPRR